MAQTPQSSAPPAPHRGLALRARLRGFVKDVRVGDPTIPAHREPRSRADWAFDLSAALISALFVVLVHIDDATSTGGTPLLIVSAVTVPIAVGLLFLRRARPFGVAMAIAVLSVFSPGVGFAAVVATYSAGAWGQAARAKVAIAAMIAAVPFVTVLWADQNDQTTVWSNIVFGVTITLGVGAWGLYAGARRQLLASLEERALRAESEQGLRIEQARAQERTRIAREMHDVLAHRMSLLSVHAGALEFRPDAPPADVARAAGVIRSTAHEALEELRTVIGVLRASDLTSSPADDAGSGATASPQHPEPPQPTLSAVPHLVEEWRVAGARIDLDLDLDEVETLAPTLGRTAYRVVQEALTNAGKHAPTARVEVHVHGEPGDALTVSVANPLSVGRSDAAASAIPGTGLGLVGLRERIALVGGVFAAGIDEDLRRFVLVARIPWVEA